MIDRRILWAALAASGGAVDEASFKEVIMRRLGSYGKDREAEITEAVEKLWQAAHNVRLGEARERARLEVEEEVR